MKEIEALIQKAERYLKSAELLLADGDYESSVSRTYYAMLYCAQAALLTKQLSFSSHKGVISLFGEYFIKTGIFSKDMSKELSRAFTKRQLGITRLLLCFLKQKLNNCWSKESYFTLGLNSICANKTVCKRSR